MSEKKILKIAIGVPSLETWPADFALSLIGVSMDLKSRPILDYEDGCQVNIINRRSSVIPQLREDIVDEAKKIGADWLLWVDSDQTFPIHTARQLLGSGKEVIGCNIAVKKIPSLPTARKFEPRCPLVGDVVYTTPESTGLEQIWRLGFGVLLTKISVYDRIKKPWFWFDWNEYTGHRGEDWNFMAKLETAGIPVYIDHDLSKETGHLGLYRHTMSDVDHTESKIKIIRPFDTINTLDRNEFNDWNV